MEWVLSIILIAILFLLMVIYRLMYIKGYRAGARRILAEWKATLEEGEKEYEDIK